MSLRLVFAGLVLVGCGGNGLAAAPGLPDAAPADAASDGAPPVTSSSLPCDVDAVLASNCRQCHTAPPRFGAPMPLVTYADLEAPARSDPTKKVYELVEQRVHDDARP
jgi:hypothetical protein